MAGIGSKLLKSLDSGQGNLLILLPAGFDFPSSALIRLPLVFATLPARARRRDLRTLLRRRMAMSDKRPGSARSSM